VDVIVLIVVAALLTVTVRFVAGVDRLGSGRKA
jgi:hypothetical protein